ncbi:MAG: U32 family peptidase [Clostridiales bacterium]|nr:U32 family peptidase [Clostridiales bacterium]
MEKERIELLAPAGSPEGFEAALRAGADAVYVGGTAFGARAYARNFSQEELITAIDQAHFHGKKLYLTLNTLVKNRELEEQLYDYLLPCYEAGLDAVLVQDLGVLDFVREIFPGLPIHASTQMTVTGPEGMEFLAGKGVSRVVPARELSLEEIARMHRACTIEIETFIHGALCYCYSGQCLMSSFFGGRSGNRGRCAQPCRLPWQEAGGAHRKDFCGLSLKDLCTLDFLPEILRAGVVSLKIEGRMKQPAYTAGVTAVYRKYLDKYLASGGEGYRVEKEDRQRLLEIFNRGGFCGGYYQMRNGPSMMAFSNEKKTGQLSPVLPGRAEKIRGKLVLSPGKPGRLEIQWEDISLRVSGDPVQEAVNRPMDEKTVRAHMEKLGGTEFAWEKLEIFLEGRVFVPVKSLNLLRRQGLEALREEIRSRYRRKLPAAAGEPGSSLGHKVCEKTERSAKGNRGKTELPVYVSCERLEVAQTLCKEPDLAGMYLPFDLMSACLERGLSLGKEMYLALPRIQRGKIPDPFLREADRWLAMGMKGFLVRSLESFTALQKAGYGSLCVLDSSMYTWNDRAVDFWEKEGILRNTVPLELSARELSGRKNRNSELLIYGRVPLMVSAQCVRKNLSQCTASEGFVTLKDRSGRKFPVFCCCHPWKTDSTGKEDFCYNIIYNSVPCGLPEEKKQVERLGVSSLRMAFTTEDPRGAREIFRRFCGIYLHGEAPVSGDYTKGHFKRGVE